MKYKLTSSVRTACSKLLEEVWNQLWTTCDVRLDETIRFATGFIQQDRYSHAKQYCYSVVCDSLLQQVHSSPQGYVLVASCEVNLVSAVMFPKHSSET